MKNATFTVRLEFDDNDEVNPLHLCEEIQSYLNESHHYGMKKLNDIIPAKVSGYKFEFDNFIKFQEQQPIDEISEVFDDLEKENESLEVLIKEVNQ